MTAAPRSRMTLEEYLAFERASGEKHQYFDGEVYAMAGASPEHNLIVANLIRLVGNALVDGPCRVFPSDMKVRLGESFAYPDVSVVCGKLQFHDDKRDVLVNPSVIVEVLSESTELFDRGLKFEKYRALKEIRDYVLVSSVHVQVEHFARREGGAWLMREYSRGERLEIGAINAVLAVDEIYAKVWEPEA